MLLLSVQPEPLSMAALPGDVHKRTSHVLSEQSSFASDFLMSEQEEQQLHCRTHFTDFPTDKKDLEAFRVV